MLTRYGHKCILMGQADDKPVLHTMLTSTKMYLGNREHILGNMKCHDVSPGL